MVKVATEDLECWTSEVEDLLADWSEKASGYRWLHSRSEKRYRRRYYSFSIPVIILSTLTGVANAGLTSYVPEDSQKMGQAIIGGVNILAGILGTLQNFLKVAEQMESHRSASVSWSKLNRAISIELALDPKRRQVCHDFLKITRAEYDRLIEQSPLVPDEIINHFKSKFKSYDVSKPAICNGLDKCIIFDRQDAKPSVKQKDKEELLAELKEATDEDEASEPEEHETQP
jgi:hypothetical protein